MTIAFGITETMRGSHHFVNPARGPAIDRPFHFRIVWGAPIASSLNPLSQRFMRYRASGEIFVDGLTPHATPCTGELAIDYLRQHKILYDLDFDQDGERFHFSGEKTDVRLTRPLQLIKTHTTCYGAMTDADGQIVSRSVVHFPPKTLVPFLLSFRLHRSHRS